PTVERQQGASFDSHSNISNEATLIATNAGSASNGQSSVSAMAISQPKGCLSVKRPRCLTSLRNHQLRGLDHPRKRACLTAMHNFSLTRSDGRTAAERFFGQKPRSMFAAILASVEIPPAPLSPPRRAVG